MCASVCECVRVCVSVCECTRVRHVVPGGSRQTCTIILNDGNVDVQ